MARQHSNVAGHCHLQKLSNTLHAFVQTASAAIKRHASARAKNQRSVASDLTPRLWMGKDACDCSPWTRLSLYRGAVPDSMKGRMQAALQPKQYRSEQKKSGPKVALLKCQRRRRLSSPSPVSPLSVPCLTSGRNGWLQG